MTPWRWRQGPVILVRKETTPDDIHGMDVAKGILTARGGMTSHAAVVAAAWARPAWSAPESAVDEHKKFSPRQVGGKTVTVKEGDWISLDGTTGEVFAGKANTSSRSESRLFRHLHELGRRVPRQVRRARQCRYPARRQGRPRKFGAEGIGLCRTEHMFFAEDRIATCRP
jgi:pyruvate, orthophosphate dikinase